MSNPLRGPLSKRLGEAEQRLFDQSLAGELDPAAWDKFRALLRRSPDARRRYLAYAGMHADLYGAVRVERARDRVLAAMQELPISSLSESKPNESRGARPAVSVRIATLTLALAAGLLFVVFGPNAAGPDTNNGGDQWRRSMAGRWPDRIATIRRVESVRWSDGAERFGLADLIGRGEAIRFEDGLVEIEFRQGAVVVLEGPAHLVPNHANGATLLAGKLAAVAPPWATGFRIDTPGIDVIDHGTEFAVSVALDGGDPQVNVVVTEGEVEVLSPDQESGGRRLFAGDGVRSQGLRVEDGDDDAARKLTHELPDHPGLKNVVVVGDRWNDWLPGTAGQPRREGPWRHYTNTNGPFGQPDCYEELVWDPVTASYRPADHETHPRLHGIVRVHRDGGHPGKGSSQVRRGLDHYSITGFVIPEDGVYRIEAGWLERNETKHWKLDRVLDVAVHVNDEPPVIHEYCNRNSFVAFNGSLGERRAGDVVYAGVGPSGIDHNDRFRWGFYVVRETEALGVVADAANPID